MHYIMLRLDLFTLRIWNVPGLSPTKVQAALRRSCEKNVRREGKALECSPANVDEKNVLMGDSHCQTKIKAGACPVMKGRCGSLQQVEQTKMELAQQAKKRKAATGRWHDRLWSIELSLAVERIFHALFPLSDYFFILCDGGWWQNTVQDFLGSTLESNMLSGHLLVHFIWQRAKKDVGPGFNNH